ncbi:MAG: hypothetical protein U5J95_04580 [Balneolaceae bacterium]|nr:hypothetical protein [Balneolaceae bacterium]
MIDEIDVMHSVILTCFTVCLYNFLRLNTCLPFYDELVLIVKRKHLHIVVGSLMLIVMSISLIFSTLHSHHHLQWDHPEDFAETGNCFTKDTTVCPISGYLFNADVSAPNLTSQELSFEQFVAEYLTLIIQEDVESLVLGRAPPFSA